MAQLVRIFAFTRIKWRSRFRQNRKDKEAENKRLPPSAPSAVAIISPVKSAGAVVGVAGDGLVGCRRGRGWTDGRTDADDGGVGVIWRTAQH